MNYLSYAALLAEISGISHFSLVSQHLLVMPVTYRIELQLQL